MEKKSFAVTRLGIDRMRKGLWLRNIFQIYQLIASMCCEELSEHTNFTCTTDTQISHALQTHKLHMHYKHKNFTCPTNTQTSHALQTHKFRMHYRHTNFTCTTNTQTSHALLMHKKSSIHIRHIC